MSIDDLRAWCRLLRTPGIGSVTYQKIIQAFGSPKAFLDAPNDLRRRYCPSLKQKTLNALAEQDNSIADKDIQWLESDDKHHIITFHNELYPPLLKEIADPPPLLYVIGQSEALLSLQLAIVGGRQATEPGMRLAGDFAHDLAKANLTVTSGLALGIDGAAHRGCLAANGVTIAVAGTGLDRVYPARHKVLAHDIAQNGALVSEFPIGCGVRSENFPRRNRVISGLSLGVLVVEAGLHSGSLITARMAAEQGREVFAIPNSIYNPMAKGCHALIKQGAKLVESVADIMEELMPLASFQAEKLHEQQLDMDKRNDHEISDEYSDLLAYMGFEICTIDQLSRDLSLTTEKISVILTTLELDGRIVRLEGGRYQRM